MAELGQEMTRLLPTRAMVSVGRGKTVELTVKLLTLVANAGSQFQDQRPRVQHLQEAVSRVSPGNVRQELNDTLAEMVHLETEIRERIEGFLRQHLVPPPPQGMKGLLKKVQDAARNVGYGKDKEGETKLEP